VFESWVWKTMVACRFLNRVTPPSFFARLGDFDWRPTIQLFDADIAWFVVFLWQNSA
jgi:hypothetical protein